MPENRVGDEQVEAISQRLAEIQESLSPDQAALLSGIFSVASDAMRPTGGGVGTTGRVSEEDVPEAQVRAEETVPLADQFRRQFLGAFTPAASAGAQEEAAPLIIIPRGNVP